MTKKIILEVQAGENFHDLVTDCVHKGWFGLENLALIPGLVGAAPLQNIGAFVVYNRTMCWSRRRWSMNGRQSSLNSCSNKHANLLPS